MTHSANVEHARGVLTQYLAENGLKTTRQRSVIADEFFRHEGHMTVEEMFARVRALDERISVATVYRTMRLLADCGLAAARQFGDGQTRFEPTLDRHHHDHLICERCRKIIEFEDDAIETRQQIVAKRYGFTVTHHKLEMYGLCEQCEAAADRSRSSGH